MESPGHFCLFDVLALVFVTAAIICFSSYMAVHLRISRPTKILERCAVEHGTGESRSQVHVNTMQY